MASSSSRRLLEVHSLCRQAALLLAQVDLQSLWFRGYTVQFIQRTCFPGVSFRRLEWVRQRYRRLKISCVHRTNEFRLWSFYISYRNLSLRCTSLASTSGAVIPSAGSLSDGSARKVARHVLFLCTRGADCIVRLLPYCSRDGSRYSCRSCPDE
ncbi:hypothetical protein BKA93DRAFT_132369 [Sparassis latifolia]